MFTKASPGKCKDYWNTFCFLKACRHDAARVSQSAEGSSPVLSWGPSGPCGDSLQLVVLLLAPHYSTNQMLLKSLRRREGLSVNRSFVCS